MRGRLLRVALVGVAAAAGWLAIGAGPASAHSQFVRSDPETGTRLETAPTTVRVSFSEEPVPSLSEIRVLDDQGRAHHNGAPLAVPGDPLTLAVPVGALDQGVYTVVWRVASGVDGHRSSGSFVFGVGVTPSAADVVETGQEQPSVSRLEVAGRWTFICGLVVLLGAALARVAGFAGRVPIWWPLIGWIASILGLVMLADAVRRAGGGSFADLRGTSLGRALGWRCVGVTAAGVALLVAWRSRSRLAVAAWWAVIVGAAVAMAGHVSAGHAAGRGDSSVANVAFQWTHFVATAVWIGGLAALLVGLRGGPTGSVSTAVRRYAWIAALMLPLVVVTGVIRAVDELESWGDLTATGYGRAVLAKAGLLIGIAMIAAVNRWHSLPVVATTIRPLRRFGRAEVGVAAVALLAAALLGGLAPPSAGSAPLGLAADGTDAAASVTVELSTASAYSGGNRFLVQVEDDTGDRVAADAVSLQFLPLDDPGFAPTTLVLEPTPSGEFAGSGSNLVFDGRWRITAVVERGSTSAVVPMEVEVRGPPLFLSVTAIPGRPVVYHLEAADGSAVDLFVDPERAGSTQVSAEFLTAFGEPLPIDQMVLTTQTGSEAAAQRPVRRSAPNRFVADVTLDDGASTIAVVARTADGSRFRATIEVDLR